jgi:hypothetical protein
MRHPQRPRCFVNGAFVRTIYSIQRLLFHNLINMTIAHQGVSLAVGASLLLSLAPVAFAEEGDMNMNMNVRADVQVGNNSAAVRATTSSDVKTDDDDSDGVLEMRGSATSSMRMGTTTSHGMGPEHAVMRLRELAQTHPNLRVALDAVVRDQASTTAEASTTRAQIEHEGFWRRVFVGSDFKNLGQLRSTIVRTANSIDRLRAVASSTTSAEVKADIEAQIAILAETASTTEAFVKARESAFSLFGWLVRWFAK